MAKNQFLKWENCQKCNFTKKNNLFDFVSFFCLDFFNFLTRAVTWKVVLLVLFTWKKTTNSTFLVKIKLIIIIILLITTYFFRSFGSLPEILYHLTYITQTRYTGALLNQVEFHNKTSLVELKWINETGFEFECDPAKRSESFGTGFGCRYVWF